MNNNYITLLTNAFQLPALMKISKKTVWVSPADYRTAASVLGETETESVLPGANQPGVAQFLTSPYNECFIYINVGESEVWLGPVLIKPMYEGRVSEIIRKRRLELRKKAELTEYYQALRIISERQFYYMGKLAELLFASAAEDANMDVSNTARLPAPIFSARGDDSMFEHPPYFMELEMTRLVTSGDMDSALVTMNRINTFKRAILADDSVRSLKNSLICDCTFLARAAIAGGAPPEDAFATSDRLILKIEGTHAIAELESLERQNLIEFVSLVHSYNSAHFSKPIRNVISYINRNLGEELSLKALAELSGLSSNYLCTLFRKETGTGLSFYILNRRIEEAKFFLRYTDNPISDIANFYQFSSQSHFTGRFSQITGMTPLQYRKRLGGLTE